MFISRFVYAEVQRLLKCAAENADQGDLCDVCRASLLLKREEYDGDQPLSLSKIRELPGAKVTRDGPKTDIRFGDLWIRHQSNSPRRWRFNDGPHPIQPPPRTMGEFFAMFERLTQSPPVTKREWTGAVTGDGTGELLPEIDYDNPNRKQVSK